MRYHLLFLVLGISLSLVGAGLVSPAQAAVAPTHTTQGRAKKKPRANKKKPAKPQTKKVVNKKSPKNDIGFAL